MISRVKRTIGSKILPEGYVVCLLYDQEQTSGHIRGQGQTGSPKLQNGLTHCTFKEELIVYHEHHDKNRARNKPIALLKRN